LESRLELDAANAISRAKRLYASLQLDFVERAEYDLLEYGSKASEIVDKAN
jgi:hypothetical protein